MYGIAKRARVRLILFALLLVGLPLLPMTVKAEKKARSTELMKAYRQYLSLAKQGKYRESIIYAKRALDIAERKYGPHNKIIGTLLNNLATVYLRQGLYIKAEPLLLRSLTITEKTGKPNNLAVATGLNNLAETYRSLGLYSKAEPFYKRSLQIYKKIKGPNHPTIGVLLNNMATLSENQGQFVQAERFFKRSIAIRKKAFGPNHASIGTNYNNLAGLYEKLGRYRESELLYKRGLAIREKALGPDHPTVGASLNNLALLYGKQGRYGLSESLYKRSLVIRKKALGPGHPSVGQSYNNLAALYKKQKRYLKAEELYKRSLKIREKALGPEHLGVGTSLNNLAAFYQEQGRNKEAEPLYQRSLAIRQELLGPSHLTVSQSYNNLAVLYESQGRFSEAKRYYEHSLIIRRRVLGPDHPTVGTTYNNLAGMNFRQSHWAQAVKYWQQATQLITQRTRRQSGNIGKRLTSKGVTDIAKNRWYFSGLVKSTYRQRGRAINGDKLQSKVFQNAQWANSSEAAGALAQMSARQAKGDGDLAKLVRERQDTVGEWQSLDKRLIATRSKPPGKRDPQSEKRLSARLTTIDKRIALIDKRLAKDFPDYAALANPEPLSVLQVQSQLGPDEALILMLDTPKAYPTEAETFVFAITKNRAVWIRAPIGGEALIDKVTLLRQALDPTTGTRSAKTKRGLRHADEGDFDLTIAYELYKTLLGPVEDLIADKKHLLIIPSGPLTALPLHVLVSQKPKRGLQGYEKYRQAQWLMKRHAMTTLPSVSSLKALRDGAKNKARAKLPLIGFADPVFSQAQPASLLMTSTDQQTTKRGTPVAVATLKNKGFTSFFRGGIANLSALSQLSSLPETRTELISIALTLDVDERHIKLGRNATEKAVKTLNLDQYRIVYFATHGLVAGDIQNLSEPALAFSLPAKASLADDGLLTASEVAQLKLNADWLVMSACNTASGDKPGAQALSGLARAFFYAGARTLLVSHWPVYSDAATALTTSAFALMNESEKNGKPIGRSTALQRSMLALLHDTTRDDNAHPSVWAPFVVVGEGAVR